MIILKYVLDLYPVVESILFWVSPSLVTDSMMFASSICWYFVESSLPSTSTVSCATDCNTTWWSVWSNPFYEMLLFFPPLQTYFCGLCSILAVSPQHLFPKHIRLLLISYCILLMSDSLCKYYCTVECCTFAPDVAQMGILICHSEQLKSSSLWEIFLVQVSS